MYYPGEPVRFRLLDPPLEGEGRERRWDYRLATLQPIKRPNEFWLVWFLSDYEKSYEHSTRTLLTEEPESRIFWCGEGRCGAAFGVEGNCTRLDLEVNASSMKNLEQQYGEFKGEGAWLARLLKPGGLAGELVKVGSDYLVYVRLN